MRSLHAKGNSNEVRTLRNLRRNSVVFARVAAACASVAAGAALLASAGCNIIVPAAYILEGPPTVDAAFVLPEGKRTVVFVDDTKNDLPRTALRVKIGDTIVESLLEQGLVTEAISSSDAMQVARRRDTDSKKLSIAQIGEECGAEIVIYVKIKSFMLTPDGSVPRPIGETEVKVLDIGTGERIFPDPNGETHGYMVDTQLREMDQDLYRSSAGRRKVEDALATEMAKDAAKVFYKHQKNELGGKLGVRG